MHVDALRRIDDDGKTLRIGAAVRQEALERHAELARRQPLLSSALAWVGHAQTRARGTICGSMAHADPSAELPLSLMTLGGSVHLRTRKKRRTLAATEFFTGMMATAKADDEMIEAVSFPAAVAGTGYAFAEVGRRHGDFAIVACAAMVDAGKATLGIGGVADVPAVRTLPLPDAPAWPPNHRGGRPMPRLSAEQQHRVSFTLNGKPASGMAEPRMTLSDFLRHVIGATGTHVGCEHGVCGACTVQIDGGLARSCLALAVQTDGCDVRTVEGLSPDGGTTLSILQDEFRNHHGLQCGFCTPGFLMTLDALFRERPDASTEEIRETLSGHLCRCTGYAPIMKAALAAQLRLRGETIQENSKQENSKGASHA